MVKIVGLCGSTRKESYNKKLLRVALGIVSDMDLTTIFIDLKDYPLPLYDADYESDNGIPENAVKLKKILADADYIIFSSPEYNSSISGVLKNSIDWCSRISEIDEKPLSCFIGKKSIIMSTSPGKLGGLRGLYALRDLLENIKVTVFPEFLTYSGADKLFNEDGFINDLNRIKMKRILDRFMKVYL